ncbi:MAG: SDR family oxidoreductase [Ardenticatenaceae bacterium]|nr:SDR family oxidoreductase [Ardenticatenaceae bacterium]
MRRLEGKVALVTGAGQGIGKATAVKMAREGARVVFNDIFDERLRQAEADIQALGGDVLAVKADMTRQHQVEGFVARALDRFGQIDVLVNNVGGTYASTKRFLHELEDADWHNTLDLNLTSNFLATRAALPHMRKRGSGKIINVASLAAVMGEPLIWSPPYAAAKAAVLGLTRQLAIEQGPYGITVNAIAQADVLTERTLEHLAGTSWPETYDEMMKRFTHYPLGRLAQPEEIANVIFFLATDDANFMNGETVLVSGGVWFG